MKSTSRTSTGWMVYLLIHLSALPSLVQTQQNQVKLDQGAVVGLKVFPDSSRTAVYTYLGLPYAQAPVGNLRFAPPMPHRGWNWTLQAVSLRPVCPQLANTVYDETADGTLSRPALVDEDCLYLNIWVPEVGLRFGNLPVLVMVSGERMTYDWPHNRATGLDFAAEGAVVVSIQYRSNIFGWINLGSEALAGNYGLQDQELALKWVHENIQNFGGNPNLVTLLGHGTSGGPCALALSLKSAAKDQLVSKLVLMSVGDAEQALTAAATVFEASQLLVRKLGCQFEERGPQVVACLRSKSVSDLLKAFETIYDHGNGSLTLGPVLPTQFREALVNRTERLSVWRTLPPIVVGITSNEGAFLHDYWLDMARNGYQSLRAYVNYTVIPRVLRKLAIDERSSGRIVDTLNWRYFSGEASVSAAHLLNAMQRLISESFHETPFYQLLEELTEGGAITRPDVNSLYVYIMETANAVDMRGKVNIFGGASHSSDLPLLLGPSLFQQISRRRLTPNEDKLCRKIRSAFANFVKSGNPTPGRIYDAWLPYTREKKFIFNLGEALGDAGDGPPQEFRSVFERNLPQIEKLLESEKPNGGMGLSRTNRNDYRSPNPYQLAAGQTVVDGRRTKSSSTSYLTNQQDSGYALHLKRVYGFWQVLLPQMAIADDGGEAGDSRLSRRIRLLEASADAARYKHGFFAMLGLVSVLLAILALCVYLLRRDPLRMSIHSSSGYCL